MLVVVLVVCRVNKYLSIAPSPAGAESNAPCLSFNMYIPKLRLLGGNAETIFD